MEDGWCRWQDWDVGGIDRGKKRGIRAGKMIINVGMAALRG